MEGHSILRYLLVSRLKKDKPKSWFNRKICGYSKWYSDPAYPIIVCLILSLFDLVCWIRLPGATCYLHHLLIINFLRDLQNLLYCIPIDVECYVDFKNVYFYIPILRNFPVMAIRRPERPVCSKTGLFRPLNKWS